MDLSSWILKMLFCFTVRVFQLTEYPYDHKHKTYYYGKKIYMKRIKENALQLQTYYEAYVNTTRCYRAQNNS